MAVVLHFEAAFARSDKVECAFATGLEFDQCGQIDGRRRVECLELKFLERFDGRLGLGRLT